MKSRDEITFATIRTEGALLPPDILQRIGASKDLDGLRPEDYHLVKGERLNEAINRSWNRLVGIWSSFVKGQEALPSGDVGTSLTRERWLLPLFQELGYGRLQGSRAVELDGKSYAISHRWGNTPIHLVGCNVELDRRTAKVAGASRTSPHSVLQDFLNRSDDALWGILSNGLILRVLRDNVSLTRQAFVEFDLQAMMEGERYSDFVLLWLLCHQSRVEGERGENCWLERWSRTARDQGVRALDVLRDGVQSAIETFGRGFIAHRSNGELRDRLRDGDLLGQDYYRQILRLVYRLIFLFVAEDRELLLLPDTTGDIRDIYKKHYSTARLRKNAQRIRGTDHPDLYRALRLVMDRLSSDQGCPELGLPALGGFLFSNPAIKDLRTSELSNSHLLEAIRLLAFRTENHGLRPVDFKNLGAEELGSVYESLLELHPVIDLSGAGFTLSTAAGNERKTTGSYYTPESLIHCLMDSALDPVLNEAVKKEDPERALLDLKICDPACGSGHFLIAAANRLAKKLAAVRTGDDEPSPDSVRKAMRDVVGRCIFGVDINPMSVELCKVGLWMEALEPGKPLSFLDHHIRCGNSLLGTTPALMARGIPDDAFKAIQGDDKDVAKDLRKCNKNAKGSLDRLNAGEIFSSSFAELSSAMEKLGAIDDSSILGIRDREEAFGEYFRSDRYEKAKLLADGWCSAFVWEMVPGSPPAPTEDLYRQMAHDLRGVPESTIREIQRIAQRYGFFHWHLAFPTVFRIPAHGRFPEDTVTGWEGGFDCVLGNPPWERIKIQEKEWFADKDQEVAKAANASARQEKIDALREKDPDLHRAFMEDLRVAEGSTYMVRSSGLYPLCGSGDVNTYALFAEMMRHLQSKEGRVGCVVPSGIATDNTTQWYFRDIMERGNLASLHDFENRKGIFPGVHKSYKFCLLTLTGDHRPVAEASFAFFLLDPEELRGNRPLTLSSQDIALINPNTRTCPIFRTARDGEITKSVYRRMPILIDDNREDGNPWGISFKAMFHMSNDSGLFMTLEQLEGEGWTLRGNVFEREGLRYLPLYEAKMVHHFDHRWGTYDGADCRDVSDQERRNPGYSPLPRYWVPEEEVRSRLEDRWDRGWLLGWRRICRSTDERMVISVIAPLYGCGDSIFLALPQRGIKDSACIFANLNSLALDYIARQKQGGINLNYHVFKQLPILPPHVYDRACPWDRGATLDRWIGARVLELTYTALDMEAFARDLGFDGPPFSWDDNRRFAIRCELDAAFFHLYGLSKEDVEYVMETFPIVKKKDQSAYGEFRTKRTILEIFDSMKDSIDQGHPYVTALPPEPGLLP